MYDQTIIFFFLISLKQIDCLYSIYRLNEENPSFAIHGVNLDKLGSITIYGLNGSDFLVDFTQRDCMNVPDHLNQKLSLSKKESDLHNCLDPFPLSINGGIPERDKCKEVMPYDRNFTRLLYMCSFKIPDTNQLIVKTLNEAISLEYAISFRVSKWVDVSRRVLVVPTNLSATEDFDSDLDHENVLINQNTVAIIVLNPKVYGSIQTSKAGFVSIEPFTSRIYEDPALCEDFKVDMTCPLRGTYSYYVGADPGLAMSTKYHVDDGVFNSFTTLYLRDSVGSFFSKTSDCSFCLIYAPTFNDENSMRDYLYDSQMISSYNYLWPFDDPKEFPDCQSIFAAPFSLANEKVEMTIEFNAIEGVHLTVTGWRDKFGSGICGSPVLSYNESFEALPEENLVFMAHCIQFTWCPALNNGERFGFKAILTKTVANRTGADCIRSYKLNESDPQLILHPSNIMQVSLQLTKPICVFQDCPLNESCPFLVDISMNCEIYDWDFCGDPKKWRFLEINNVVPVMTNCITWESPLNLSVLIQCQLIVYDQVFFQGAHSMTDAVYYLQSSVSVRVPKWIDQESQFYLLADLGDKYSYFQSMAIVFPPQDQISWISISLFSAAFQLFQMFRSAHDLKKCQYRWNIGAPDYNKSHPERHLFTFSDSNQFIEQYFETELYSILVPRGCSPSIAIYKSIEYSAQPDEEKEQEICNGVAIIASRGYQNPFEYSNRKLNYQLNRTITCSSFQVDVIVELVARGIGELSIEVYDEDNEMRAVCPFEKDDPLNCTISRVSALKIHWTPLDQNKITNYGCFIRVHISKSELPSPISSNLLKENRLIVSMANPQ